MATTKPKSKTKTAGKTPAKAVAPKKAVKPVPAKKVAKKASPVKKQAKPNSAGQAQAKPNPVGRPSLYKPEYAEQARKFALLGATDKRMAELFGVNEDTFHEWKKVYPEFSESLTRGKDIADAEIANSLYHRAKGYEHPEDDIRVVSAGGNSGSEIIITPTVKRYPPDTGAAALWLANRQKAHWRQKVDVEHSGPDGGPIQHSVKVKFV